MKFRFHKGSLADSMNTCIEVNCILELKHVINRHLQDIMPEEVVTQIKYSPCGYDDRIGWDTYYVIIETNYSKGEYIIGMSDGFIC